VEDANRAAATVDRSFGTSRRMVNHAAPAVVLLLRVGIGGILIWSALLKIRMPYEFLAAVFDYNLVGPWVSLAVAMVLPWGELVVGVCLLGGLFIDGSFLVSAVMSAIFVFVTASAWARGLNINCGCFGGSSAHQIIGVTVVLRAIALFASASLAVVLRYYARRRAA